MIYYIALKYISLKCDWYILSHFKDLIYFSKKTLNNWVITSCKLKNVQEEHEENDKNFLKDIEQEMRGR